MTAATITCTGGPTSRTLTLSQIATICVSAVAKFRGLSPAPYRWKCALQCLLHEARRV
jgi:hypothetical protein